MSREDGQSMGLWRYGKCVMTQRGSVSENRRQRVAWHDESSPEEPSKKWFSWQWSLCCVCCASLFSMREEREREREREREQARGEREVFGGQENEGK